MLKLTSVCLLKYQLYNIFPIYSGLDSYDNETSLPVKTVVIYYVNVTARNQTEFELLPLSYDFHPIYSEQCH